MKDELTNHLISVSKDAEDLLNNLMESYKKSDEKLYLGYFEDERVIGTKIEYLKLQNSTLKKYIPIENNKDNAN